MKYLKKYNEVIKIDSFPNCSNDAAMKEIESYFQYVDDDGFSVQITTPGSSSLPMGLVSFVAGYDKSWSSKCLPYACVTVALELYAERAFNINPDECMFETTDDLIKGIEFAVKGLSKEGIVPHMIKVQHRTYNEHHENLYTSSTVDGVTLSSNEVVKFLEQSRNNNVIGYEGKLGYINIWFYIKSKSILNESTDESLKHRLQFMEMINIESETWEQFEVSDVHFWTEKELNNHKYQATGAPLNHKNISDAGYSDSMRVSITETFTDDSIFYEPHKIEGNFLTRVIKPRIPVVIDINKKIFDRLGKKYDFTVGSHSATQISPMNFQITFNIYFK